LAVLAADLGNRPITGGVGNTRVAHCISLSGVVEVETGS
jgi:hypothetical protein